MTTLASQITSLAIVYSIVYSDADQRKHQSSASLAFVRGIHRGPVNFPHKGPVTRKMFPFDDVIMATEYGVRCLWTDIYWCLRHIHWNAYRKGEERHGCCTFSVRVWECVFTIHHIRWAHGYIVMCSFWLHQSFGCIHAKYSLMMFMVASPALG